MIAAVAAIFAACGDTDTFKEVNEDVAIGFNNYVEKTTKAEITSANITSSEFGVFGYKYKEGSTAPKATIQLFNNERVYYQNNDWKHDIVRYWDKSVVAGGADQNGYFFYAYAPYKATNTSVVNFNRTGTTNGFTYNLGTQVFADATESNTIDLCVARAEDIDFNNCNSYTTFSGTHDAAHVVFIFNHVLSKLTFNVKKGDNIAENHTVTLNSLDVAFPTVSGTGANVAWTQTSKSADAGTIAYTGLTQPTTSTTKTSLLSNGTQNVTTSSTAITDVNSYIVTPNTGSTKHTIQLKVGYTITLEDNTTQDVQTATGTFELTYVEKYHYILTIVINPDVIEFDVDAVNDFSPESQQQQEVK